MNIFVQSGEQFCVFLVHFQLNTSSSTQLNVRRQLLLVLRPADLVV